MIQAALGFVGGVAATAALYHIQVGSALKALLAEVVALKDKIKL